MADLTKEVFDTLPTDVQSQYVEVEGGYSHSSTVKVGGLKSSLDLAYSKRDEAVSALTLAEQTKADEIAQARELALEEAKSNNNVDEINRLEREKLDDAMARLTAEREELDGIQSSMASDKQSSIIDRLALKATDDGREAFKRLVKDYILVDPKTRQETFLNEDGSASSLNEEGFYTEFLSKNPMFKTVLKADINTKGGGDSNGSMDSGANQKAPKDMTSSERIAFKERDPLGFKQAFKL